MSIIVPHHGGSLIARCLRSVLRHTPHSLAFEIVVVVDGGKEHGALRPFVSRHPAVRIVSLEDRRGFGHCCNRGAREARGSYLLFLNDDVVVAPGWLPPLISALEAEGQVAVCGPKVRSLREPRIFDYSGGMGGLLDKVGYPFTRGRMFATLERDEGQYDGETGAFWIAGCCMLVRRRPFFESGGFDEIFFMQMEEIDLCWRLRLRGHEVRVCSETVVYHYGGGSLPQNSLLKAYLNHRNNLVLLLKNYSAATLGRVLPWRLLLEAGTVLYALWRPAQWRHGVAVILSFLWLAFNGVKVLRARVRAQRERVAPDSQVLAAVYGGSIVVEYFFRGRRTLSSRPGNPPARRSTSTGEAGLWVTRHVPG